MADLSTSFAGLQLKNPLIVSSSGLTNSAAKNKTWEEAGAAAVVLKSVFEEQILLHAGQMQTYGHSEGDDYMVHYVRNHQLNEYVALIRETKSACSIPVIASINCHTDSEWVEYASMFEEAGADALEINILSLRTERDYKAGSFQQMHVNVLKQIANKIRIPVVVKLGSNLTAPVAMADRLSAHGAAGMVLFNRFYQPDINIDKMEYTSGNVFSTPADLYNGLRWTAILSSKLPNFPVALSGGVHDGDAMIKALLAGASAVEVCSAIYQQGPDVITKMLERVEQWQESKGFTSVAAYRGRMNASAVGAEELFERTQFMRYYSSKAE